MQKGKKKHDGMKNHFGPKKEQKKFKIFGGSKGPKCKCFVCEKIGHYARGSRHNKFKNKENVVQENDNIITTVSEILVTKGKVQGRWYDTCTTDHVSYDKTKFKTYYEVIDGQEVQMGNEE